MIVYRIEHQKYKIGPYTTGCRALWNRMSRYWNPHTCPDPSQDGLRGMRYSEYSGFSSMKQMTSWFLLRDIFKMRKQGFRVYKFKVEKRLVRQGEKQVCFVRYAAKDQQEVALRILAWHRAKSLIGQ